MNSKSKLKISQLRLEDGLLKGGFAALTDNQMNRINGMGNSGCSNESCTGGPGTNQGCSNMVICNPYSNDSNCANYGDCRKSGSVLQ